MPAGDDRASGTQRLGAAFETHVEYRFGLVLALLLATFVFLATGPAGTWAKPVTVGLQGATLMAALFAAGVSRRWRLIVLWFTLAVLAASFTALAFTSSRFAGAVAILNALLVAVAPVVIARSIVRRHVIDVQTVMAALCIYVLLGMLWAFVYTAVGELGPNAFFAQTDDPTSADYLYFSFVTQTTTGYGDLTAANRFGRACAVLEALIGQIYLVTIVALLVSNLTPRRRGAGG
jgi:hypothetical protein